MLVDVKVPTHVMCFDYNHISVVQDVLSSMTKGIKIRDIRFSRVLDGYICLVYTGRLDSEENRKYIADHIK